jgi:hypothetical protein
MGNLREIAGRVDFHDVRALAITFSASFHHRKDPNPRVHSKSTNSPGNLSDLVAHPDLELVLM